MDETDLRLIKHLWEDPRCSYRDLADSLGISTPAVHRRIQAARDSGILLGPFAHLSVDFVNAVPLTLLGVSAAGSPEEIKKNLSKGDTVYIMTMLTGNYLLVHSVLKDISCLDRHVEFVRKAASMKDLDICLPVDRPGARQHRENARKITKLDLKIMNSLYKDGRKTINEIAEEIHISPKTVRNHLRRLTEEHILVFEVIANQSHSGNFVPLIQVRLDEGADKNEVIMNLNRRHTPPLIECISYSNHPHMFITHAWLQNMGQLKDLVSRIESEEGVRSVVPHIFVNSHKFETWMDNLLADPERAMSFFQERNLI